MCQSAGVSPYSNVKKIQKSYVYPIKRTEIKVIHIYTKNVDNSFWALMAQKELIVHLSDDCPEYVPEMDFRWGCNLPLQNAHSF